jgi:hypothetical protein
MSGGDCAQIRTALGVYLLGAIDPRERAQLADHLASCPACREKLAALAGLPALLQKVPADEAIRSWADDGTGQPPGPPLEALLAEVARTRRRRRWRAIAAAAVLAVGLAAGLQAFRSSASGPPAAVAAPWTATVTGTGPATGVWAAIRYAAMPWGSELEVRVTGVAAGTLCELLVTGDQGQAIAAAGWTIAPGGQSEWVPASVRLRASALRGFEVTSGGRALVSVPAR